MDILNLKIGQVIKNYIELCKLLDVKPTKGKGRNYHIQEFERYCKYHKQGQKFIVDEVYAEPLPKVDGRVNNGKHISHTIYDDLMDNIVLNILLEEGEIEESFNGIFNYWIDLFTVEYEKMLKAGYEQFAKKHNISKGLVLTYQQKMRNILNKLLETTLNRLQKQGIIKWKKRIKYIDTYCDVDFANKKLTDKIDTAKKKVLNDMKITYANLAYPNTYKKYVKKVCKELDNVMNFWNVYCIKLIKNDIDNVETDIDELKKRLILQLHKAVRSHKSKDDFGKIFYPYMSETNKQDTIRLDKLLWRLPKNYIDIEEDFDLEDIEYENVIPF